MKYTFEDAFKKILFFSATTLWLGVYIGAKSVREAHLSEKNHHQKVLSNCLEVIFKERPKDKICSK